MLITTVHTIVATMKIIIKEIEKFMNNYPRKLLWISANQVYKRLEKTL